MFPTTHGADILMRKQAMNQGYVYSVAAANVGQNRDSGDKDEEHSFRESATH